MSIRCARNAKITCSNTYKELVPAPAKGCRHIVSNASIYNADTAGVDYIISIYDGVTYWPIRVSVATLASLWTHSGSQLMLADPFILETGDSLVVKTQAAVTANEVMWTAHYLEDVAEGDRVD